MQTSINMSFQDLHSTSDVIMNSSRGIYHDYVLLLDNGSSLINTTGGWSDKNRIVCDEGFYLENNSQCTPLCNFWVSTYKFSTAEDVVFVTIMLMAVVSFVILFIMAVRFQRDTM